MKSELTLNFQLFSDENIKREFILDLFEQEEMEQIKREKESAKRVNVGTLPIQAYNYDAPINSFFSSFNYKSYLYRCMHKSDPRLDITDFFNLTEDQLKFQLAVMEGVAFKSFNS